MKAKKKNTPAEGGNLKPPKAAEYVRRRIDVDVGKVHVAAWNPRGKITPESVADLAASIRTLGMIQPVVCMMEPNGSLTLIAGHRRLVAAKLAGLKTIPCEALDGLDEATAKRMTFIENLHRLDADPLLESELVGSLVKSGMTHAEIAAETGRGEKWVARRANLVNLSPSWRDRVKSGEQITIDCLEHVAAYPMEIQEKLKDTRGNYYYGGGNEVLTWSNVKWEFLRETRDLKEVLFDTEKCRTCPMNTGCCHDLFDDEVSKDALGKCLDAKCYGEQTEQAVADAEAKAEKRGSKVVKKSPYKCGVYGSATKRPTKTNTVLYVYNDSMGKKTMEWAPPPPIAEEKKAKTKEEKQAEREAKNRLGLLQSAKDEAESKFNDWTEEHANDGSWPKWFVDCAVEDFVREICEYGSGDLESAVDAFARNTGFTASNAEADKVYQEYLAKQQEGSDE